MEDHGAHGNMIRNEREYRVRGVASKPPTLKKRNDKKGVENLMIWALILEGKGHKTCCPISRLRFLKVGTGPVVAELAFLKLFKGAP